MALNTMIQIQTKLIVFLFVLLCVVTYANRLPPDSDETAKIYILESPLYNPLAGVALHVEQFIKGIPGFTRSTVANKQWEKILSIAKRVNRVKPALQHIVVLATSPQASDTSDTVNSKALKESFDSLRNILMTTHHDTAELATNYDNSMFLATMQELLNSIQKALYHASSLSPNLVSTLRVHPMMEKFVITEYIPHAEKIFNLKKNLQEVRSKPYSSNTRRTIEQLIDQWTHAHNQLEESSISLLKLVDVLKNSVQKNSDPATLQHFSAFLSLLSTGGSDEEFENLGPDSVISSLNRVESSLLAIAHKTNPIVQKNKDKLIPFPVVVSVLQQIKIMVEKLTQLHEDLHSTQEKLRYMTARMDRSRDEDTNEIIKSNNTIRSRLNRLQNDISHAHSALRNHMAYCLTKNIEKSPPQIDFMSPMLRFAELEKIIKKQPHAERFIKNLEEIRHLLLKFHNDARRFNKFEQIVKARKAKLITE